MEHSTNPKIILLFSGKRKSGKDYVSDLLFSKLNPNQAVIIKISAPIKSFWAKSKNLDLEHLLSSSSYKELYRREMIEWSEKQRCEDAGIFCRQAIEMYRAFEKPIWIVSDVRRQTDVSWFEETFPNIVEKIRIDASEETRKKRGWMFTAGIDDELTECGLDHYQFWDWKLTNDNENAEELNSFLSAIIGCITNSLTR